MRILVVEDERQGGREGRRAAWKAERYAVDVAGEGDTGWAMVNTYPYDLVVLDLGACPGSAAWNCSSGSGARTPGCRSSS